MSNRNFRELLKGKWAEGKLVCIGLDSEYKKLPECLRMASVPNAILTFNRAIVDQTHDLICAYKPNTAFYEAQGDEGLAALQLTIQYIQKIAPDVPVILDAKRGDIGNTNNGYVEMAFTFLDADAITVHPYMGQKSLQPFLDCADKGIFVLCRTSNNGAGEFQDLTVSVSLEEVTHVRSVEAMPWSIGVEGCRTSLSNHIAYQISKSWNKNDNCGLVVGATHPLELQSVRRIVDDDMPVLIPGIGKQEGDLEATLKAGINENGQGVIINSSRGIIFASDGADFAEVARQETQKLDGEIKKHLAA